jgi:hypothetical protein
MRSPLRLSEDVPAAKLPEEDKVFNQTNVWMPAPSGKDKNQKISDDGRKGPEKSVWVLVPILPSARG